MGHQLFPAWADTLFRVGLGTVVLGTGLAVVALFGWERSPQVRQEDDERPQPVKFDHRHHVRDDGIDCLYCHSGARKERWAGLPDSQTCMGCHNQIWTSSPELAPIRESVAKNVPIVWNRVTDLPDHVYFHHGAHVQYGLTCDQCHGDVDTMPRVYMAKPMTMAWCLQCHREYQARGATHATTNCTTCHR
jgi:hypothetical protein